MVPRREFIHDVCRVPGAVEGSVFYGLTDPYAVALGVVCTHCQRSCRLDEVRWNDTGETIADFRSRMRGRHGRLLGTIRWLLVPLLGGVLLAAAIPLLGVPTPAVDYFKAFGFGMFWAFVFSSLYTRTGWSNYWRSR